jgi:MFS family permease
MILVVIVAGIGVWPASYVVSSETSSLHLRGKAQGIAWFSAGASTALFAFVMPYVYNPDQGNLEGKTGFVYAALCALSLLVSYLCVPEMKGRTTAEIDEMFEQRLPTRQFRQWGESGDERSSTV